MFSNKPILLLIWSKFQIVKSNYSFSRLISLDITTYAAAIFISTQKVCSTIKSELLLKQFLKNLQRFIVKIIYFLLSLSFVYSFLWAVKLFLRTLSASLVVHKSFVVKLSYNVETILFIYGKNQKYINPCVRHICNLLISIATINTYLNA